MNLRRTIMFLALISSLFSSLPLLAIAQVEDAINSHFDSGLGGVQEVKNHVAGIDNTALAGTYANTEYYYTPQNVSLNNVVVNNANNPPPQNGSVQLVANNIVASNYSFQDLLTSNWSAEQWTGLRPVNQYNISQKAIAFSGKAPDFGATIFQADRYRVGMHLNTFPNTYQLPTQYTAASLQYFVGFPSKPVIWAKTDLLCMSGLVNIASSYTEGSVNQIMMTMRFEDTSSGRGFFLNVMMFDSRPEYQAKDFVHIDQQDTGDPIIISHAQNQSSPNINVIFTSPVPDYGNPLTAFASSAFQSGVRDYGFCINPSQFSQAVNTINGIAPASKRLSSDLNRYILSFALIGPEVETSHGRGHVGMSIEEIWVYRRALAPVATATYTPTPTQTATPTPRPTNTPTPSQAKLTIMHDVVPDTATNFQYGGSLGAFKLDDISPQDSDAYANSKGFTMSPGAYAITVTEPISWMLKSISCTSPSSYTADISNSKLTVNLTPGGNTTCTFIHQRFGTVEVYKFNDLNSSGLKSITEPYLANWEMKVNDGRGFVRKNSNSGGLAQFDLVRPGPITVCETQQSGWISIYPPQPIIGDPCITLALEPGTKLKINFGNRTQNLTSSETMEEYPEDSVQSFLMEDDPNDVDGKSTYEEERTLFLPLVTR